MKNSNNTLSLVGTGIKSISHLTTETTAYIKQADYVLYLVNEPIIGKWIEENSKESESLEVVYFSSEERVVAYERIVKQILSSLKLYNHLCVVIYGHPTVFSYPGLKAVNEARKLGFDTKIIPAISVEDCLFADLGIDPCNNGCYSVEATDLILYDRVFDPYSSLIIWQPGVIGDFYTKQGKKSKVAKELLRKKLLSSYPCSHSYYIYEAPLYPTSSAKIRKAMVDNIVDEDFNTVCTLYFPPIGKKEMDKKVLKAISC